MSINLKQSSPPIIFIILCDPGWLSIGDLAIASALMDIGFVYGGLAKDFHVEVDRHLGNYQGWNFYGSKNEIVLDAVCKEALFLYALDLEDISVAFGLEQALSAIKTVEKRRQQFKQHERVFNCDRPGEKELDLNVVPVSLEGLVLSVLGIEDNSGVFRLKREIQLQEELLLFERKKSPEYREILANLDELMRQFWGVSDLN